MLDKSFPEPGGVLTFSQKVVCFLGWLEPLYVAEVGQISIRRLSDGARIMPAVASQGANVVVWWQGDPSRETLVPAIKIAEYAIAEFAQVRRTMRSSNDEDNGHSTEKAAVRCASELFYQMTDLDPMSITEHRLLYNSVEPSEIEKLLAKIKKMAPDKIWDILMGKML